MAETADYDPGEWKKFDWTAAKSSYDATAGRSYATAASKGVSKKDLVLEKISSKATRPLMIFSDVTGSMGRWPAIMFEKLPYLDHEIRQYLGEDAETSFCAVGDHISDKYPLQVNEFATGVQLAESLKKLVIEGNGGGQIMESYLVGALYCLFNVELSPTQNKPIVIFIGDESNHPYVTRDQARDLGISFEEDRFSCQEIFSKLKEKFSPYIILKPYDSSSVSREVERHWLSLLGEDRIVKLDKPERVVDVIFGILAKESNKSDYFRKEIEDRQTKDQVDVVYRSLKTLHLPEKVEEYKSNPAGFTGKSVMLLSDKGKKANRLMLKK